MQKFFDPTRNNTGKKSSIAKNIIRETIRRGGKIDEEVFRKILRAKISARMHSGETLSNDSFRMMLGKPQREQARSHKAQMAIDQMREVSKARLKKKERKEIIIIARSFNNGRIDAKGRIYDSVGNMVAQVNRKTGFINTIYGENIGMYKAKSMMVNSMIINAINRNSPYLKGQRQNILIQKQLEEEEARKKRDPSARALDVWGHKETHGTLGDIWG